MKRNCERGKAISRRTFLQASTILTFAALPELSYGADSKSGRLLLILLRGGMDGLYAMPAIGDPSLERQRQHLIPDALLKLDGFFALHPALITIHDLYNSGQALLVHGTSNSYKGRSHFEGQDIMESGVQRAYASKSGWLGRALDISGQPAITMSLPVPLVLRGKVQADSSYPTWIRKPPSELYQQLAPLWANDADLADLAEQLIAAVKNPPSMSRGGGFRPGERPSLSSLAREAGLRLRKAEGPRVAILDYVGFDTHASQPGQYSRKLNQIDDAIDQFHRVVGEKIWKDTLVVTVTEFGRTVAENGSLGTDHGWGTCVFVLGGALKKSGIVADWPGLQPANLFEGRDLKATIDSRALYGALVSASLGIDPERVRKDVIEYENTNIFDGYLA